MRFLIYLSCIFILSSSLQLNAAQSQHDLIPMAKTSIKKMDEFAIEAVKLISNIDYRYLDQWLQALKKHATVTQYRQLNKALRRGSKNHATLLVNNTSAKVHRIGDLYAVSDSYHRKYLIPIQLKLHGNISGTRERFIKLSIINTKSGFKIANYGSVSLQN